MMLHKLRIALAATLVALAAVSAVDSASAQDNYEGDSEDLPILILRASINDPNLNFIQTYDLDFDFP
jgi:hypothetical protein